MKGFLRAEAPPRGFVPSEVTPPLLPDRMWPVSDLALDVSGSCNLACRYCAEAATQPRRRPMAMETFSAALKFLLRDERPRPGSSIRFGSGEPLLALPLLKRVQAHLDTLSENGPVSRLAVFLTTNGTLIDKCTGEWLAESGWHVKISLDGPEPIHDAYRITPRGHGTYRGIAAAARMLAQRIPERFGVTSVLCRGTDPKVVFDGIEGLGAKRIEFVPAVHRDPSIRPGDTDVRRYEVFVRNYARRWAEAADTSRIPTLVRFAKTVARVMGYNTWRIQCGAGRSFFGVGPAGDLYPCFRFIGIDKYRLGHVSSGPDPEAARAFRCVIGRTYEQRSPCRECWSAPLCGGPCFACAELFGPGDGEPYLLQCAYTRADARAAVWLVKRLRKYDPQRLLFFLPRLRGTACTRELFL